MVNDTNEGIALNGLQWEVIRKSLSLTLAIVSNSLSDTVHLMDFTGMLIFCKVRMHNVFLANDVMKFPRVITTTSDHGRPFSTTKTFWCLKRKLTVFRCTGQGINIYYLTYRMCGFVFTRKQRLTDAKLIISGILILWKSLARLSVVFPAIFG